MRKIIKVLFNVIGKYSLEITNEDLNKYNDDHFKGHFDIDSLCLLDCYVDEVVKNLKSRCNMFDDVDISYDIIEGD